jgi:TonB family protein
VSTAVCGNGILEAGEQCDDGNTSDGDGCSSTCIKDVLIDPTALQALLASGDTNVPPSKAVRDSMIRYHQSSLKATLGLCISTSGVVTQSRVRAGTGYDDYDRKLLATVRAWRYRPYVTDNRPAPACSTVEFIYNPG